MTLPRALHNCILPCKLFKFRSESVDTTVLLKTQRNLSLKHFYTKCVYQISSKMEHFVMERYLDLQV